jgi:2-polyprenyl-3-methyl-5-hydroxy-6-metoxy-1,4-benzoquinol methylase
MKNSTLTTKEYWQDMQEEVDIFLPETDPLFEWLNSEIKNFDKGSVFEVGCYPGKFLYPFALSDFEVSGIDFIEKNILLEEEFKKNDFKTGNFYCGDFFQVRIPEKYDVVTSFGFIEHFLNFEKVIQKQASLVKNGGYIIIEVPNFLGFFQLLPHFLFANKNLKQHNLKAMRPKIWRNILESMGFQIIKTEYTGGYHLRFRSNNNSKLYFKTQSFVITILEQFVKYFFIKRLKTYSCLIVLVAKKIN